MARRGRGQCRCRWLLSLRQLVSQPVGPQPNQPIPHRHPTEQSWRLLVWAADLGRVPRRQPHPVKPGPTPPTNPSSLGRWGPTLSGSVAPGLLPRGGGRRPTTASRPTPTLRSRDVPVKPALSLAWPGRGGPTIDAAAAKLAREFPGTLPGLNERKTPFRGIGPADGPTRKIINAKPSHQQTLNVWSVTP